MEPKAKVRDVIVLRGKTRKGENRVREHGDRWLVREVDRSVLGGNLGLLVCPASYVGTKHLDQAHDRPSSVYQVDGYCRWVRPVGDQHFEIVEVEE